MNEATNSPLSSPLAGLNGSEFSARFCYWQGISGRRYIHSVYAAQECPPLPGSLHLLIRPHPQTAVQEVIDIFIPRIDEETGGLEHPYLDGFTPGDFIHVHMLANDETELAAIADDLAQQLFGTGFTKLRPLKNNSICPLIQPRARKNNDRPALSPTLNHAEQLGFAEFASGFAAPQIAA